MNFKDGWTPEQWGKIPSLRQLDAWLAWHLFGLRWMTSGENRCLSTNDTRFKTTYPTVDMTLPVWEDGCIYVPHYSTYWGAMGLVVEAMKEKHQRRLLLDWDEQEESYIARWHPHEWGEWGSGADIPETVANAAYRVLERLRICGRMGGGEE